MLTDWFKAAFDFSPLATVIYAEADGRILDINARFTELLGYERQEVVGRTGHELGLWCDPETRARLIARTAAEGQVVEYDARLRSRHGGVLDMQLWVQSLFLATGRLVMVQGVDVTSGKWCESLLAAQRDLMMDLAMGGPLEPSLRRICDFAEQQATTMRCSILLLDPASGRLRQGAAPSLPEAYRRAVDDIEPGPVSGSCGTAAFTRAPVIVRDIATDPLWASYRPLALAHGLRACWSTPILTSDGAVLGTFAMYCAEPRVPESSHRPVIEMATLAAGIVLERHRAEESRQRCELARQNLEAQLRHSQKLEAVGTMAGGIAHDFNNILAVVVGQAELALSDLAESHPAREAVLEVLASGLRARDLVRQILTFSRLQPQHRRPLQLDRVLPDALKLLRASLPAQIRIRTDFAADLPAVLADETQLHQVMTNLGANAAHAMLPRGGELWVTATAERIAEGAVAPVAGLRSGRYVRVEVRDTGHGIEAATLRRIFEPFFTTKSPGEGTGLGLAVVHGIMESHGGGVTVLSTPGLGTTFTLLFPVLDGVPAATAEVPSPPPVGRGERILLLDDERPVVEAMRRTLARLNYSVTACVRGDEALEALAVEPGSYALVISDLTMPGRNGLEIAEAVHRIRPDLPVILMSGHARSLEDGALRERGIRAFLPKPFEVRVVADLVREALGIGDESAAIARLSSGGDEGASRVVRLSRCWGLS